MRTTTTRALAMAGVTALTIGLGSAMAAEGGDTDTDATIVAVTAGDEELVDRLLLLEPDIPQPLPSGADIVADRIDYLLAGSFASARSNLDAIEGDLRQLFIDADEAQSEVSLAVAAVTHGLLTERQALLLFEESDGSETVRPLDVSDERTEDGVAVDADGPYGRDSLAVRILLDAREEQRMGYELLALADVEGSDVFAAREQTLLAERDSVERTLRVVASTETPQLLLEVDRWDAPIGLPRAAGVSYVCVDREVYEAMAEATEAERLALAVREPDAACAEAARLASLPLSEQVALDPTLDGIETAVGTG